MSVVLVGMSVTDVRARGELLSWPVDSVAFLQLGDPSVGRELTRLADAGAQRIVLVGVSLGRLAPGVSWLRRIAAHWWRDHGGRAPDLLVAPRLVTCPADVDAAVATARPVTGAEPGLTSPAWEQVTGHRHQVLVCRGPRCTARGSEATAEALVLALLEHGLGDDDVLLTHTGCQFPCNQAPVVSVQPGDVWYGGVDAEAARQVVAEHLRDGRPVAGHRLPR